MVRVLRTGSRVIYYLKKNFSLVDNPLVLGAMEGVTIGSDYLRSEKRRYIGSFRAGRRYFAELDSKLKVVLEAVVVRYAELGFLLPAQRKELSTKRSSCRHDAALR